MIGIAVPFSKQELVEMLNVLVKENNLQNKTSGARVTITHGESARGILPLITPLPNYIVSVFGYTHMPKQDYSALIVNTRKNEKTIAARVKAISYLDNILAKQEANNRGYDEAILLNTESNVADGSISNVFIVKNERIYTPPVYDGALPGIVRSILLKELKFEFSIVEQSVSIEDLFNADEVFLTNALMGIQSVSKINKKKYLALSVTNELCKKFRKLKNYI